VTGSLSELLLQAKGNFLDREEPFVAFDFAGEFEFAFELLEVGDHQLGVFDDLDVAAGVRAGGDMDDIFVVEAAHHMDDGGGLADIGEELVAEPFSRPAPLTSPAISMNSTVV
jgi:hypothetical protein